LLHESNIRLFILWLYFIHFIKRVNFNIDNLFLSIIINFFIHTFHFFINSFNELSNDNLNNLFASLRQKLNNVPFLSHKILTVSHWIFEFSYSSKIVLIFKKQYFPKISLFKMQVFKCWVLLKGFNNEVNIVIRKLKRFLCLDDYFICWGKNNCSAKSRNFIQNSVKASWN